MVCHLRSHEECTNGDRQYKSKSVNRTTKMCVVDSQCQYPFVVARLLNAVSLRGNTCITIEL